LLKKSILKVSEARLLNVPRIVTEEVVVIAEVSTG